MTAWGETDGGGDGGPAIVPDAAPSAPRLRPRTENMGRLSRRQLALWRDESPPVDVERPRTRGDCASVERPCPFVSCRHSLYLEVSPGNGSIKRRFPGLEPDMMDPGASCVLDVADRGGLSLTEVGHYLNVTKERARQIELAGVRHVRAAVREEDEGAEGPDDERIEEMAREKKSSKAEGRRVEIELPCRLSTDELVARGETIAKLHAEAATLRVRKKQASEEIGGEIKAKEAAIATVVGQLRTRTEPRKVECVEELDFRAGVVKTIRTDTKDVVATRALTPGERQPALFPIEGGKGAPPVATPKKRGRPPGSGKKKLAAVESAPAGA